MVLCFFFFVCEFFLCFLSDFGFGWCFLVALNLTKAAFLGMTRPHSLVLLERVRVH